jgi:hypothetical protein
MPSYDFQAYQASRLNAMSGFYPVGHLSGLGAAALVSRTQREHDPTQVVRSPLLEDEKPGKLGNRKKKGTASARRFGQALAPGNFGACAQSGLGAAALVSRTQREHDPTQVVRSPLLEEFRANSKGNKRLKTIGLDFTEHLLLLIAVRGLKLLLNKARAVLVSSGVPHPARARPYPGCPQPPPRRVQGQQQGKQALRSHRCSRSQASVE